MSRTLRFPKILPGLEVRYTDGHWGKPPPGLGYPEGIAAWLELREVYVDGVHVGWLDCNEAGRASGTSNKWVFVPTPESGLRRISTYVTRDGVLRALASNINARTFGQTVRLSQPGLVSSSR